MIVYCQIECENVALFFARRAYQYRPLPTAAVEEEPQFVKIYEVRRVRRI